MDRSITRDEHIPLIEVNGMRSERYVPQDIQQDPARRLQATDRPDCSNMAHLQKRMACGLMAPDSVRVGGSPVSTEACPDIPATRRKSQKV